MANNLLKRGETMLASKLRSDGAEEVSITRGAFTTTQVKATIARQIRPVETSEGNVRSEVTDQEFLIDKPDYVINSVVEKPLQGDVITATIGGVAMKFKVQPTEIDPAAHDWGVHGLKWRIHAKYVGDA